HVSQNIAIARNGEGRPWYQVPFFPLERFGRLLRDVDRRDGRGDVPECAAQLSAGLRIVEELAWIAEVNVARSAVPQHIHLRTSRAEAEADRIDDDAGVLHGSAQRQGLRIGATEGRAAVGLRTVADVRVAVGDRGARRIVHRAVAV